MIKYIHLNYILRFIREEEGIEFKIVNSKDFGIEGISAFKIIIPKIFEVSKMEIKECSDGFIPYEILVLDKEGNNALDGPNILLWNSELYSTAQEESVCLADEDIDNVILVFDGFVNIPPIISSKEILKYI